ncbi:hypothetical protein MATR_27290 [Marivirga tractuosa]|uniref:Secreted protein n=1 Tax=Marivirga tractuosa (strain ATCC 23168 / DSM 4126 / NBRC 15989 / NCIMB 1408 / VKM B-1430 / H-43) TaxID=643867 RepID=E4TMI7_MARTH|nr:hypothetical protein [Marivirga tractuosa]ADR23421.1 hypothetical protein Ftrac_3447 [Marivirga tractuosa DSM 4126]BDD15904.1 hypothetical protein MATR_27290 [Marivirga tractuosa]
MKNDINFVSIAIKFCLSAILIFASIASASGQSDCLEDSVKYKNVYMERTHNVIGLVPSKARVTNGWAIGWEASLDNHCVHMDSIRINGLHTNVFLPQAYIAAMSLIMAPFYPRMLLENFDIDTLTYDDLLIRHKLNGVSISLFEFGKQFAIQGLHVTAFFYNVDKLNGVSITSIAGKYKHFNGVMISGILNKTNNGKGLQIGLINSAAQLNGMQIGLWNRIGKRGFPLINMNFKKTP